MCFWYFGFVSFFFKKKVHCQSEVFLCFHSEMWKLLYRGIIVLVRKRHHSVGLRVEAMNMSYITFMYLYELLFGLRCDTVVAFFYCMTLLYGKITKCKAGKFALEFLFLRSRWVLFQPDIQDMWFEINLITVFLMKSHKIDNILLQHRQFLEHSFLFLQLLENKIVLFIASLYMSPMCTLYILKYI